MSTCDHICRECGGVINCQHCKPYRLPADAHRIAELEDVLRRVVHDAQKMIQATGYRTQDQAMLYAEAQALFSPKP